MAWFKSLLREISKFPLIYILLGIVLIGAIWVRIYNTQNILGFYYDEGRDAIVINNFLEKRDLFLIGPTTGIRGILRGPWYYWLITPAYFLGRGDPVWPANFLALTTVGAIVVLYLLGKEIFDRPTGLIAAAIASFSYYLIVASRWLSNPTPMLLISMFLVGSMILVIRGKRWAWAAIALLLAMAMQFGSATETFYIPAVAIFALWTIRRQGFGDRSTLNTRMLLISGLVFIMIFLPQIIFDLLKGGILSKSVWQFLVEEKSFKVSFWQIAGTRLAFYWEVFSTKIWIGSAPDFLPFFLGALALLAANFKKLWARDGFRILLLLTVTPFVGMLFFQGNEGNVFDYYFTGYYFIFILLFSAGLGFLARNKFGLIFLAIFFLLFFKFHLPTIANYLINGRSNVTLGEQLRAIDWIYENSKGEEFNVDVYVPPVIAYAYDYLIAWRGKKYNAEPTKERVGLLYTLYEEDIPKRLDVWLARQETVGKVEKQISFRGITVQRRQRYDQN